MDRKLVGRAKTWQTQFEPFFRCLVRFEKKKGCAFALGQVARLGPAPAARANLKRETEVFRLETLEPTAESFDSKPASSAPLATSWKRLATVAKLEKLTLKI